MKKAIIIMAKVPTAGKVKTRLQPFLSGEQCRELATCFLRDVEAKSKKHDCSTIVAYSPKHKKSELLNILQHDHILIEQAGEDLGERMYNAFEHAFQVGFDSVVMIGTDSPTFPDEALTDAFRNLETGSDAVMGKTEDGGYYLVGLSSLTEGTFDGVDWGTEKAFEQTQHNLLEKRFKLKLIQPWYDVDFPEDFERLKNEFEENPVLAPHTSEWLKKY